ncbi:hypothetical protein QBC38DRAFT_504271 [Podospora fimiseda]|uniref:Uncharacterized protein n=1 Tax=Podospora fimiseda TaxID=252190 RepID=A0AAN7BFZ7_9PEZI|nr:hypothetical protein QBC38DRAFT_504271 [Podospora fimiseda]
MYSSRRRRPSCNSTAIFEISDDKMVDDNISKTGCYYPDKSPADGRRVELGTPVLYPCSPINTFIPVPVHVTCCQIGDTCMGKNLCAQTDHNQQAIKIYRGGCTDPTYSSDSCPNQCTVTNAPFFDPLNTTVPVIPCSIPPLPTVFAVCVGSTDLVRNCTSDAQGLQDAHGLPGSVDDRQGFLLSAKETMTSVGIALPSLTGIPVVPTVESAAVNASSSQSASDAAGTGITGGGLVAAIAVPVTITVGVLITCIAAFIILRRKSKKQDDAEVNQTDNDDELPQHTLPMTLGTSPSPLQQVVGGNELDATPGSASNRQELPTSPSPTTTLWPIHRPTQSYPSQGSPVPRFPPLAANGRPASLSLSHTLPALSPLSPLSPLDSEHYRPSSSSMRPEISELATNRTYMPYRPPTQVIEEDDVPTGLSAPPRDPRTIRRSSTAPGAFWSEHPNPLASNPPLVGPATTSTVEAEPSTQHEESYSPAGWEERFTETGPAA